MRILSIGRTLLLAAVISGCASLPDPEYHRIYLLLDPTVSNLMVLDEALEHLVPQEKSNALQGGIPEGASLVAWVVSPLISAAEPHRYEFEFDGTKSGPRYHIERVRAAIDDLKTHVARASVQASENPKIARSCLVSTLSELAIALKSEQDPRPVRRRLVAISDFLEVCPESGINLEKSLESTSPLFPDHLSYDLSRLNDVLLVRVRHASVATPDRVQKLLHLWAGAMSTIFHQSNTNWRFTDNVRDVLNSSYELSNAAAP
jgi:hypothetical protein